jgi:hypothetical protein
MSIQENGAIINTYYKLIHQNKSNSSVLYAGFSQQYWGYDLVYHHIHDASVFCTYINVRNPRRIMNDDQ